MEETKVKMKEKKSYLIYPGSKFP